MPHLLEQTPEQKKRRKVADAKLELITAIYHKANYFALLEFARKIGITKNPLANTYPEIAPQETDRTDVIIPDQEVIQ